MKMKRIRIKHRAAGEFVVDLALFKDRQLRRRLALGDLAFRVREHVQFVGSPPTVSL